MRTPILLACLLAAASSAQSPPEKPAVPAAPSGGLPWEETPPSAFATCAAEAEAARAAQRAFLEAQSAADAGPPLPGAASGVRPGAPLYGDPQRTRRLAVTADAGTVALTRAVGVGDEFVFEGTYSGDGSRFRVFVAPDDTDAAGALEQRRAAFVELRAHAAQAAERAEATEAEAAACHDTVEWSWRQERAAAAEYALTRATASTAAKESADDYSARAFSIGRGDTLWIGAMNGAEDHFLVQDVPNSTLGWIPSTAVENPDRVRQTLRPKMERWDRQRQEREQARFAATPDLLFTELVAVGNYSLSGFRFSFYNLRAGKTIRYLYLTAQPYNRVGDVIPRSYGGGSKTVTLVGPSEPSTTTVYSGEFDDLWFTEMVECVRVTSVRVVYMDGTSRSWQRNVDSLFEDAAYWNRCP